MKEIYYKIQYYNPVSLTYVDLQKSFKSIEEAVSKADSEKKYRIMQISGKKRNIVLVS